MRRSRIAWCDFSGRDLNFVVGCTPVSAGCRECYARRLFELFGRDFSEVKVYPEKLGRLRRCKFPREGNVRGPHSAPLLFPVDLGDLFHPAVPATFIAHAFTVMSGRRDLDWIVLTKRPERMRSVLFGEEGHWYLGCGDYIGNIILGITGETQALLDERLDILTDCWEGTRMVSLEPMLEPISFERHVYKMPAWVIVGAESGPNRRPFDLQWARDVRDECQATGTAFFFKQSSALRPGTDPYLDGRLWREFPS